MIQQNEDRHYYTWSPFDTRKNLNALSPSQVLKNDKTYTIHDFHVVIATTRLNLYTVTNDTTTCALTGTTEH